MHTVNRLLTILGRVAHYDDDDDDDNDDDDDDDDDGGGGGGGAAAAAAEINGRGDAKQHQQHGNGKDVRGAFEQDCLCCEPKMQAHSSALRPA